MARLARIVVVNVAHHVTQRGSAANVSLLPIASALFTCGYCGNTLSFMSCRWPGTA
jgi:hypothetical protein